MLRSGDTTLTNTGMRVSGGVCGETDDAGVIKAEWEVSGVWGRMRVMFGSVNWE